VQLLQELSRQQKHHTTVLSTCTKLSGQEKSMSIFETIITKVLSTYTHIIRTQKKYPWEFLKQ
jgi:hypothetical protein